MSQITGAGPARIAWGYRTAAELGAWKITISRDGPSGFSRTLVAELRGDTIDLQALRQTDPPLAFVVPREGRPALTWPIVSIHIGLAAITAELGAKEGSNVVAVRSA
jgi:hypothetical protein